MDRARGVQGPSNSLGMWGEHPDSMASIPFMGDPCLGQYPRASLLPHPQGIPPPTLSPRCLLFPDSGSPQCPHCHQQLGKQSQQVESWLPFLLPSSCPVALFFTGRVFAMILLPFLGHLKQVGCHTWLSPIQNTAGCRQFGHYTSV